MRGAMMVLRSLLLCCWAFGALLAYDQVLSESDWSPLGTRAQGVNGDVFAIVPYGDGYVIAGDFDHVGALSVKNIAYKSSSGWSDLGGGCDGVVRSLAVDGSTLYVGGEFITAGGITVNRLAAWNGSAWSSVGGGVDNTVHALLHDGSALYAGGRFLSAGGNPSSQLVRWDGSSFISIGNFTYSGDRPGRVQALLKNGDTLYVGGSFHYPNGSAGIFSQFLSLYNTVTGTWSAPPPAATMGHLSDAVSCMAMYGSQLYLGGAWSKMANVTGNAAYGKHVICMSGTSWLPLEHGIDAEPRAMLVHEPSSWGANCLYVAGNHGDPTTGYRFSRYFLDGNNWAPDQPLNEYETDLWASSLCLYDEEILVGGAFTVVDSTVSSGLVTYRPTSNGWRAVFGDGFNANVRKQPRYVTMSGSGGGFNGIAGFVRYNGSFFTAGDKSVPWDAFGMYQPATGQWLRVGYPLTGYHRTGGVRALEVFGGKMYAAGSFLKRSTTWCRGILSYDGTNWASLGGSLEDYANDLCTHAGKLIIAGAFVSGTNADNSVVTSPSVIAWNGSTYEAVGAGLPTTIYAVDSCDGLLYAGGYGLLTAWNGSTWTTISNATSLRVEHIAAGDHHLYVSGILYGIPGVPDASRLACFDGSSWSAIANPVAGIYDITAAGSELFLAGMTNEIPTHWTPHVMKYDGATWVELSAGLDDVVDAIYLDGGDLLIGGDFAHIGSRSAIGAAIAHIGVAPSLADTNSAADLVLETATAGTTVGITIQGVDPEGSSCTYSLIDDDGGRFAVNGSGVVTVAANVAGAASRSIEVLVSDGLLTRRQRFTITVQAVPVAPTTPVDGNAAANQIIETASIGSVVGITAQSSDANGDTVVYSLSDNAGGRFAINSSSGVVTLAGQLNYTLATSHTITVVARDGTLSRSASFTIAVLDDNAHAPSTPVDADAAANGVAEDAAIGATVGLTAQSSDGDGDSLGYSLSDSAGGRFAIDPGTGLVTVAGDLDHEAASSHSITVVASDGSLSASATFTIQVADVNEAPSALVDGDVAADSVAENAAPGSAVGITVQSSDPDGQALTYGLSNDADGRFSIDASSGVVTTTAALDYESTVSHAITITASDGTFIVSLNAVIAVTNVNDHEPTGLHDADPADDLVAEDAAIGSVVGVTIQADDGDGDALVYSISGADADKLSCDPTTGVLTLAAALDYELASSLVIDINASDADTTVSRLLTIAVGNVNDNPPTAPIDVDASADAISEDAVIGTAVGITASSSDADGAALTYSLVDDHAGTFVIDALSGVITTAAALDYETTASYTLVVVVSDGLQSAQSSFALTVLDVNDPPSLPADADASADQVAEDAAVGTTVGLTATASDRNGDSVTFSLVDDAGGRFAIDAASGVVTVAAALDYETTTSHQLTVAASDGVLSSTADFTIAVLPINDTAPDLPVDSDASPNRVDESASVGTPVGVTISAGDADGDAVSYAISGLDSAVFACNRTTGVVTVGAGLAARSQSSYTFMMVASDGLFSSQAPVTVLVGNGGSTPSVPVDGDAAENLVAEHAAIGTAVGITAQSSDAEGDPLTYSLGDDHGGRFAIDADSGVVSVSGSLDYEVQTSYDLTVVVSDGFSTSSATFTVAVGNLDDNRPTAIRDADPAADAVAEDAAIGTAIGITIAVDDADGLPLTYAIAGAGAAFFACDPLTGVVTVAAPLDHEAAGSLEITISGGDSVQTLSTTRAITILNVNDNPPVIGADADAAPDQVDEQAASGSDVGLTVTASDADGDALQFSLGDDAGGRFAIDASSGVVTANGPFDHASSASHDITVVVSDGLWQSSRVYSITVAPSGSTAPVAPQLRVETIRLHGPLPAGATTVTVAPVGGTATAATLADGLWSIDLSAPAVDTSYVITASDGNSSTTTTITVLAFVATPAAGG